MSTTTSTAATATPCHDTCTLSQLPSQADCEQVQRVRAYVAKLIHDLRTPMQGVLGAAILMRQDSGLSETGLRWLDIIESCGRQHLRLVDDLLDAEALRAGRLRVAPQVTPLRPLLHAATAAALPCASGRGVRLVSAIAANAPPCLHTDPHRLRQVLDNLIDNAVKYCPGATVWLEVGLAGAGDDPDVEPRLRITVRDSGPGIYPEQLNRLGRPFERGAGGHAQLPGHGLGLVITRDLVELLGGSLQVRSTPGQGSEFWFTLPLAL